jgi:hypothetical protein
MSPTAPTLSLATAIRMPSALDDGGAGVVGRRYVGERGRTGPRVLVVDGAATYPLRARTHDPLWSFSWGRLGASARELGWSILYDSAHDVALADDWCASFTADVISRLPREAFCFGSHEVLQWLYDDYPARELLACARR